MGPNRITPCEPFQNLHSETLRREWGSETHHRIAETGSEHLPELTFQKPM
jgi:hypothetical protein